MFAYLKRFCACWGSSLSAARFISACGAEENGLCGEQSRAKNQMVLVWKRDKARAISTEVPVASSNRHHPATTTRKTLDLTFRTMTEHNATANTRSILQALKKISTLILTERRSLVQNMPYHQQLHCMSMVVLLHFLHQLVLVVYIIANHHHDPF